MCSEGGGEEEKEGEWEVGRWCDAGWEERREKGREKAVGKMEGSDMLLQLQLKTPIISSSLYQRYHK